MNTINSPWAVDKVTKEYAVPRQEIVFEIYADGLAPVTKSNFYGAPKYVKGGAVYYGKNLQVDLPSNDAVSGVEKTYYSIDGGPYTEYKATMPMNNEGARTLVYYAADNVGNAEKPNTRAYTVDLTPPNTKYHLHGDVLDDNTISARTNITLTSSDNLSGVKTMYYIFDNNAAKVYSGPVYLAGLSDGEHRFFYYSKDNVMNIEDKDKSPLAFYLDRTPPVTEHDVVGDQFTGQYKYVSERTKLELSATDNKSGIKKIGYIIDGAGDNTYTSSFTVPNKLGLHTVKYYISGEP